MRRRLLLCLLVSLPAWADAGGDLAEANRLLGELQEEAAVQVLTRALDRGDASAPETAQLCALLGLARFNLQDEEGAALAFRRALDAREDAELPPRASPKTRSFFLKVRARWSADRAQALAERSSPPVPAIAPVEAGPPPSGAGLRAYGIVAATAGVLAVAAGGTLTLISRQERELAQNAEVDATAAHQRFLAADSMHRWGTGVLFAGGALTVAGAALAFWGPGAGPVRLAVGPTRLAARVDF